MYLPDHFRENRLEVQHELIRQHPLGLLVSAGEGGLMANPVPFLLDAAASANGTLRCHVARPNPQWRELLSVAECLVVFQGPQAYITPSWYASKREHARVVPTWNYVTVHAWGRPKVIEDADWLRRQIESLTRQQESPRGQPWQVDDAPAPFIAAQIKAIVGIEIPISRVEGKWKVSQNRPEADRASVRDGLLGEGGCAVGMARLLPDRSGSAED